MGGNLRHLVSHVQKGESLEPAGMGGEEGGGKRAALDAHGRENGNGHGQGAAAEAGHVVDGGNTRCHHGVFPLFSEKLYSGSYFNAVFPIVQERRMCYTAYVPFPKTAMPEIDEGRVGRLTGARRKNVAVSPAEIGTCDGIGKCVGFRRCHLSEDFSSCCRYSFSQKLNMRL